MKDEALRVTWLCLEWPTIDKHVGGVGRYTHRLGGEISREVRLTVVSGPNPRPIDGVEFVEMSLPTSRLGRYYAAAVLARKLVRETAPDVVHSHGDDWALRHQAPLVRSFYGTSWGEAMSSTGLRRLNHVVLAGTEWISKQRSDLRIGIAPESADWFDCHAVMPPFVAPELVEGARKSSQPTVAFIGAHQGRKQGWLAEKIVGDLRDRSPQSPRLIVVGPQDDAANWAPWVEHHAGLDDREVAALVTSAWILISPSTYEGFGIPILEALAHSTRVVALSNPGSNYIAGEGSHGLPLVVEDSAEELAQAVQRALTNPPDLANDERGAARQLVATMEREGSASRLVAFYRELARDAGAR
ncbi:glycosyltransferase family 4 protein [Nocardioides plantarum]|uniref:Glycosyltransferase family 4 protein n=1 Tax=Nocardioides plantarum TaxID=29299 RepID=A0ABV5K6F9_9ACTN|nr:glycosyltransferase family 4 protein [Nocardioides plantarum]